MKNIIYPKIFIFNKLLIIIQTLIKFWGNDRNNQKDNLTNIDINT
jgi:hypothetical protein